MKRPDQDQYPDSPAKHFSYIHSLPVPVFIVDVHDYSIQLWNSYAKAAFSFSEEGPFFMDHYFAFTEDKCALDEQFNHDNLVLWFRNESGYPAPIGFSFEKIEFNGKDYLLVVKSSDVLFTPVVRNSSARISPKTNIQDLFTNLFSSFPVGIFFEDTKTHSLVYANATGRKYIGARIIGKPFIDVIEEVKEQNKRIIKAIHKKRWYLFTRTCTFWFEGKVVNLVVCEDITDTVITEKNMLQSMDSMTGTYNRQAGISNLQLLINQVLNDKKSVFTVCFLDLNDLKYVNDNFGHSKGDEYIMIIVDCVRSAIRQTDIVARMGGDEFLIIFPNCVIEVVEEIMETVSQKLDSINSIEYYPFVLSVSFGITEVSYQTNLDIDYIMDAVDAKMYMMKKEYKKKQYLEGHLTLDK